MLNKHNLNIAKLAAKDESRYTLTGIRVSPDETCCTDGHQLTRVTTPKMGVENFPAKDGFTPTEDFEPFLLPSEAALSVAKALPKKSTIPVLIHAAVGEATDDDVQIAVTNLETFQLFDVRKMKGEFPSRERINSIIPDKAKATVTVRLNPEILVAILLQVRDFSRGEMVLRVYDAESAIRIDASNDDQEFTSALMPMRS
ncbi:hypothetical protein LCGC14_2368220 [marine sediment metagenome]|uniref:DNA polymerase III beta sliding clamp central domain-containing protein n=1 Tax=marine sediment metagenome TaxID=412755 RepID=A0A0F9C4G5_9ZZZZ